jgi:glycosyltransferase involved in cell wall biosynthesis
LGTGPEEKRLREMAGDGVWFFGMIEDVKPYLTAVDLYVQPSSTEGLSNSLLEAMSCGLPVIATGVGAAPEIIMHGENGWLIPAQDSNSMLDAVLRLLGDKEMRSSLGGSARQYAVMHYDLPGVVFRLRELYERLLDGSLPLL